MADFITRDKGFIPQSVYEDFQDNLRNLIFRKEYDEGAVWALACYKETNRLTFSELADFYKDKVQCVEPSEVVRLVNAVRGRVETPKRKSVTVSVNVDLYYEIDTTHLPTWMNGEGVASAVEEAFGDVERATFDSFSSVLQQAPSEVIIHSFNYDP